MKCENCGMVEADCEFDIKSKDGSTIQGPVQLCWNCLEKRMASIEESEKKNDTDTGGPRFGGIETGRD